MAGGIQIGASGVVIGADGIVITNADDTPCCCVAGCDDAFCCNTDDDPTCAGRTITVNASGFSPAINGTRTLTHSGGNVYSFTSGGQSIQIQAAASPRVEVNFTGGSFLNSDDLCLIIGQVYTDPAFPGSSITIVSTTIPLGTC